MGKLAKILGNKSKKLSLHFYPRFDEVLQAVLERLQQVHTLPFFFVWLMNACD